MIGNQKKPPILAIHWNPTVLDQLKREYQIDDANLIERGGFLCGKKRGNTGYINSYSYMPSLVASSSQFLFDQRSIELSQSYCGSDDIIGMWHTHSINDPKPSIVDRNTTKKLNLIGCVITKKIMCFYGDHDLANI